jgi:hypothetical protein
MVKAFAWGRSETLWKLRRCVRTKCLLKCLRGSQAVLRSEYLINRENISSISCNLKVRYYLMRSRHQLLSQAISLHLTIKLCFSIFLSFTTVSATLFLSENLESGVSRKYQKHYPLFYAIVSVFLSFCTSNPRTLSTHTTGTKNFLSYM